MGLRPGACRSMTAPLPRGRFCLNGLTILPTAARGARSLVKRILVATDESETAGRAVEWAAEMADRYAAELLLLSVIAPENLVGAAEDEGALRGERLAGLASRLAGARGRARVVYDSDPAD